MRLNNKTSTKAYIVYAGQQLLDNTHPELILKATGAATASLVRVIENLRSYFPDLHVLYEVESVTFEDVYLPKLKGLKKVTKTRIVGGLKARLSLDGSNY